MMMKLKYLLIIGATLLVHSCKKDTRYVYQVSKQEIYQSAGQKNSEKSTTQFISIAYNDIFGANITSAELNQMDIAYQAFGDKHVLEDMIIKNFLNRSGAIIPTANSMHADLPTFVNDSYLRFYNRKPSEFEAWKLKDLIDKNADITPKMVYYSLLTGEEYRYY